MINEIIRITEKVFVFFKSILLSKYVEYKVNFLWIIKKDSKKHDHGLDNDLIISLTSYPARFGTLPLTLKCLLNQTIAADNVVLWIAHKDKDKLTNKITDLVHDGLTIKFCEDIKSYKKIIPALIENCNRYIITADDDVYYEKKFVEKLLLSYKKYSGNVIANRTHIIKCDKVNKKILPYNCWIGEAYNNDEPEYNFLTGVAGVLYPPNCFHGDVVKKEIFMNLAPNADDIWLYWMIRLNNNYVYNSCNRMQIISWMSSQESALNKYNVNANGNDKQINNLIEYYGIPLKCK